MNPDDFNDAELHRINERNHPEVAPHTCAFCQHFIVRVEVEDAVARKDGLADAEPFTLTGCLDAAVKGCAFCRYLFKSHESFPRDVLERPANFLKELGSSAETPLRFTTRFHDRHVFGWEPMLVIRGPSSEDLPGQSPVIASFQLYAVPATDHPADGSEDVTCDDQRLLNAFLPPNLVPDSELSWRRARRWLNECGENHRKCTAYRQDFMPKRLLHISADGKMVILEAVPGSFSHPYATLSYCWGGRQPVQTTVATLPTYTQEAFNIDILPASIRDGIKVTFHLGILHLWVDALCIIQDDPQDVQNQIAQMHSIYAGSAITISATTASSSTRGFLRPRDFWRPIRLTAQSDSGALFAILAVPKATREVFRHDKQDPLFTRAWAYQENQISCRVLSFSGQAMAFFCLESQHQDGGNYKTDFYSYAGEHISQSGFINPGLKSLDMVQHPLAWTNILTTYSKLSLSVPTDKLPALSALAEEYARRMPVTEYLAGLWLEDLPWQLLWTTHGQKLAHRSATYCAPSWSCCSFPSEIIFRHDYKEPSEVMTLCEIISIATTPLTKAHVFGQVTAGRLRIKGRMKELVWCNRQFLDRGSLGNVPHDRGNEGRATLIMGPMTSSGTYPLDRRLRVDLDEFADWLSDSQEVSLAALEICRFRSQLSVGRDLTNCRALLLKKVDHGLSVTQGEVVVYCRVGVLKVDFKTGVDEDWFGSGATDTEVIII